MVTSSKLQPRPIAAVALLAGALGLAACNVTTSLGQAEGIGFREARFAEFSAMRGYRACRDDALELDKKARSQSSVARYSASARLLEKCEADLGPEGKDLAEDERMRAYALSVQNHFKAGDVARSRTTLEVFKKTFPDRDLTYADGSSFVETMEVLSGLRDRADVGEFAMINVNDKLKAELRRLNYWKRN